MAIGSAPSAAPWPANKPAAIGLALIALTLVVYGPACWGDYDFINFDDPDYVTTNAHVLQGITFDGLKWAFTTLHAYNWHPLTWISLQLDVQLFGSSAQGFHFTNVLLHALNSLLLFVLLRRLTGELWSSAAVAAFFAVHPAHVESVAWITERKDVLSTLFWLLTTMVYARYAEKPGAARYLLTMLCLALGLMAKPMLVTLPAVLLLMDFWPLRRWPADAPSGRFARAPLRRLVAEKLPLFLLVAASLPLTLRAQAPLVKSFDQLPLLIRCETALIAYAKYIGMMFWPFDLAFFYPHPRGAVQPGRAVAAGVLLIAISAGALRYARRRPYLLVGWLWFVGTLVPVIGLMQVGKHELATRYTYVPYVGLFISIAWGVADATAGWRARAEPLGVMVGGLLAACVVCAVLQVRHWQNSETLWRHSLRSAADNPVAHHFLGEALASEGRLDEAERELRECLRLDPQAGLTHVYLATLLAESGRLDEAADHFRISLTLNPNAASSHIALARIREQQGRLDEAERHFANALRVKPDSADALAGLGSAYERQGKLSAARDLYEAALGFQPQSASLHNHLGRVLNRLRQPAEAVAQFDLALQLQPKFVEAINNKGVALEGLNRFADAAASYRQAVKLDPKELMYRLNLAYALHQKGDEPAATTQYAETLRMLPNWPRDAMREAWTLATDPDASGRDGARALRTATIVCQATGYRSGPALDVLAAACAELGKFDEAASWQRKAVALLPSDAPADVGPAMRDRLKLYEAHKAFRTAPDR